MKVKTLFRTVFLMMIGIGVISSSSMNAQSSSKLQKELEKQRAKVYKKLIQEYKNDKWKLADNNTTMEVAVLEHLTALDNPGRKYLQTTGEVSKCKSANVGRLSAVNNAQNKIAQLMQGQIEGYVSSLINADAESTEAEQDKMTAGFTKKIKISLNGALTESYSIYRENPDGTLHYRSFFLVDKEKCIAAANSAIEKSLKEAQVSLELADQIRKFVNEGLSVEELVK